MEGVQDNAENIWRDVWVWMKLFADKLRAKRKLSIQDIKILEEFQIERPRTGAKEVKIVTWSKPPLGWVKLNYDGSCRGNRGNTGGGGIICDSNDGVKAAFSTHLGMGPITELSLRRSWRVFAFASNFTFLISLLKVTLVLL